CEVFDGDAARTEADTVFCPHRQGSRALEDCKECPFARSVEDDVVVCVRGGPPSSEPYAIGHDPRVDVAEAAARTPLRDVISARIACVRADASVDIARALMVNRDLVCVPVVDQEGKLIGIVSKSDCLREEAEQSESAVDVPLDQGFHIEPQTARAVSEIMTSCVHALPEDAPVAFAVSLMAFESLHEVPVVTKAGQVVGVATALDLLQWLAGRLGYALAKPRNCPFDVL
ncbi:MAG: CBS domain-containing protein, partial [Polyangiaceae bacterium]